MSKNKETQNGETKKKGKGGKIAIILIAVIAVLALLICGGAFFTLKKATTDTLPAAPSATDIELKTVALDAAVEVLNKNTITIDSDRINLILDQVKTSVNGSTDKMQVNDLFCKLENSKGTIYGRVYIKEAEVSGIKVKLDKVFPVQIDFDVDFAAPEIVIIPEKLMLGSIEFPMTYLAKALDSVQLPENMRAENGLIYYDTSTLDSQIDEILAAEITTSVNSSDVIGLIGNIFGEEAADGIAGKVAGYAASFASDVTDVQLTDAQIVDDKLIISGQVI